MSVDFQASLFDPAAVAGTAAPCVGALGRTVQRRLLTRGAWIDLRPGWVTGSDELFARLVRDVPWYA